MKATFVSKSMQEVLRLVAGITGGPQYVNLVADKKGEFHVVASGNDATIQMIVPDSNVQEAGEVTVNIATLSGLIKNSAELEITAERKKEAKVVLRSLKGRKYTADFVSPPHNPIKVTLSEDKGKEIKFSKDIQVFLEDVIGRIGLSNVYTDDPIYVWLDSSGKGGTTMACGDQFHFALYHHADVDLGKKSFSLPLKTIRDIQQLAGQKPYKLSLQSSQIYAMAEGMILSMPLTQGDDAMGVSVFKKLIDSLKKPDAWASIDKDDLTKALENISSVYEANVPLKLSMSKGKLQVSFQTSYTHVRESIACSKEKWPDKIVAQVDPSLLADTLASVSGKDIRLNVMDNQNIFIKVEMPSVTIHYTCVVL